MLRMLAFLFFLKKADIGMIQFLFSLHQFLVIMLQSGLLHVLNRVQGAFAGSFRRMQGLQTSVVFFILSDLPMQFRGYGFTNDALSVFTGSFYPSLISKQKTWRSGRFLCACSGCFVSDRLNCCGCSLWPMFLTEPCFHAISLICSFFSLCYGLLQFFRSAFFVSENQPGCRRGGRVLHLGSPSSGWASSHSAKACSMC